MPSIHLYSLDIYSYLFLVASAFVHHLVQSIAPASLDSLVAQTPTVDAETLTSGILAFFILQLVCATFSWHVFQYLYR